MKYYVLEIQKLDENSYAHLVDTADTYNEAESKFHGKLSFAAISSLPVHTVVMLDEVGAIYGAKTYNH